MKILKYSNESTYFCNTFFIVDKNKDTLVVDPGDNTGKLEEFIIEKGLNIVGVLLTHIHYDHIGYLSKIIEKFDPVIYVSEEDLIDINDKYLNVSAYLDSQSKFNVKSSKFRTFDDYEVIKHDNFMFKCIKTPFHTKGSSCFLFEDLNSLFAGDTLFLGTIGRYDLPNSQPHKIKASLSKLNELNHKLEVFCGHGANTYLKNEMKLYFKQ